jgi:alpha-tubulin suppressor-like RCC1 family protein
MVTLQNNGGDDLTIAGFGTITFPIPLPSGTAYSVTVSQQPTNPSQTCVVSNGSGILGSAPVTNVVITCTTNTYPIGGTVTGLTGSGLLLRNNGGNDLAVSASGAFAFSAPVASGSGYSVSVATQPANPSQTCFVTGGSGLVGSAAVSNIVVTCTTNTYAVGGTVTGLAGFGLVLRNNGGNDLAVSTSGAFAFSTLVASGGSYSVSVAQQPTSPSQTCAVTNGSGTVGTAAVSNIVVACTTNRYAIGGLVSGLVGSGLVLRDNGGDDLPVPASGTFAFSTTLPSGTAYAVSVAQQPTSPSQTCAVTNGSGTLANAAVTSVTVTCTTNQYTVGGTITGLLGSGLTLATPGATNLVVPAGATSFAFASSVASGAPYSVTVLQHPGSPAQVCSVSNGSGVVVSVNVTTVAISCRSDWAKVSAGALHTVGIRPDGTLWTWGNNGSGQLGNGITGTNVLSPVQVGTDSNWVFVAAGNSHTAAIKTDGTLWAWGYNGNGNIGNGTLGANVLSPVQVGIGTQWASVAAGVSHTVAIKTDGTLWAWGRSVEGQLGNGTSGANVLSPVQVGTDTHWNSVAAGYYHTAAIKTDGTLWTWGRNDYGQIGNGTSGTSVLVPVQVGNNTNWASVAGGVYSTRAVRLDGTLWFWGWNGNGELGNGSNYAIVPSPVQVGADSNWIRVAAGYAHSVAIKTDGTLWAWGYNGDGQIGNGASGGNVLSPVQVGTGTQWASVTVGYYHTVAVKTDGTLWAWGRNGEGQLGNGATANVLTPVQVGTVTGWNWVAAGYSHVAAIKTEGTLWAWGNNGNGQIGDGTFGANILRPAQVGTDTRWNRVAAGANHTVAVKTDGTLWAWGYNWDGEIGNGTSGANVLLPVQVGTGTQWASVAAGANHTLAIKTDGTLWAWGYNGSGQIGNGTSGTNVLSPVQVGTGTQWASVAAGANHTVAIKTDRTLWAWGGNPYGQLGNGTSGTNVLAPVQVGSGYLSVAAGTGHTVAIMTDGTLWAWGYNPLGQLGNGTFGTNVLSPVQIGTNSNWTSVAAGDSHTDAIKTDGTLWAWGYNGSGQIGNGTSGTNVLSPAQVGSGYVSVAAGTGYTVGIRPDGTLWTWGNNGNGQIGNGGTASPIPVP